MSRGDLREEDWGELFNNVHKRKPLKNKITVFPKSR